MGNVHTRRIMNITDIPTRLHADLQTVTTSQHHVKTTDADTLDGFDSSIFVRRLTVADFQLNAGTGTASYPQYANDGSTGSVCVMDALGEYIEIDWGFLAFITQYRYDGYGGSNPENLSKIQHWDGEAWVDNTVDIPARGATYSAWLSLTKSVITSKIRWIATLLEAVPNTFGIMEMEMKS